MDDVNFRLNHIEDRIELTELVGRYAQCVAQGLGEELLGMFTDDGKFVAGELIRSGKEELETVFLGMTYGRLIPSVTNLTFQIDGDRATGSSTMHSIKVDANIKSYAGFYEDEYVRMDGMWKFSKRHFTFYYDQSNPV